MNDTLEALRALQKKLYALQYAKNTIDYDESTVAPAESYTGRGEALAVLTGLEYDLLAGPELETLLAAAGRQALDTQAAAEVRELARRRGEVCRIPADEYAAFAGLVSEAKSIWQKAKRTNDFALFAPYLTRIVESRRRFAAYFDPNKAPYDVWLDQYEPGLDMVQCDAFFCQLKAVLQPLVRRIAAAPPALRLPAGPWPLADQRRLSDAVMALLGIDRAHCQIGESAHPFTTEFYKGDVRITTHYHENDMLSSFFSVVHESGHALYELHTADRLKYTSLASGASMGLHEGQSRLYENYIGRSLPFLKALWPTFTQLFPGQLQGWTVHDLYRAANASAPGLIRTEADEVTYCLHIMVRYALEKRLMDGSLAVADLPDAWNAQMKELLGLDVPDNARGVLQDIHWACGDIGYFPSYALGTAYAAQIMAALRRALDVDALLEKGDLGPINAWLAEHIWQYGKEKTPAELLQNACGAPFDPKFYTDYLTEKYTKLYNLE